MVADIPLGEIGHLGEVGDFPTIYSCIEQLITEGEFQQHVIHHCSKEILHIFVELAELDWG